MTSKSISDSSLSSTFLVGEPVMNSKVIPQPDKDGVDLPLPSFLIDPDENIPPPSIPNLSDFHLPSFLQNSSVSLHISALLSDETSPAVPSSESTTASTTLSSSTNSIPPLSADTPSDTQSSFPSLTDDNPDLAADEPVLTFIKGRKGGTQACYDGYVYTYDRKKDDGTIYWQCKSRANYTPCCKGRLYTREKTSVKRQTEHCHLPSEREVLRCTAISNIKFSSSTATPGDVLREVLSTIRYKSHPSSFIPPEETDTLLPIQTPHRSFCCFNSR